MEFMLDGHRVFAATGGKDFDAAGRPVVFLHGAAGDHTAWALQTRWFAWHGRSVLALDLPGHGRSQGAPLASIGELAAWLWRALDALGAGQVSLVGHSMGGLIALEAAALAPERVEKLALLGCALPMSVNADLLALSARNDHRAIELMNDWAHGRRSHMGGCRIPGIWLVGLDTRVSERAGPGVLHADFAACNGYSSEAGEAAAARIGAPALLIAGERDLMTPPRLARRLAEKLADCRMVTIAECGHMMMGERPDETLDALKGFL
ncbi:MAG: alpha/beta fold hydrolase [Alphaproteobacteria bacterium]|nr:alpha/beta fold hydrolase [Alphaproteobacteria bacterium]